MTRNAIAAIAVTVVVLFALAWSVRDRLMPGSATAPESERAAAPASSGGSPGTILTSTAIGNPPRGEERPQIAHVAIVDLDRDGLNDVLVSDSFRNIVSWIRQAPRGTFTEDDDRRCGCASSRRSRGL
jgi:hypothetical protein